MNGSKMFMSNGTITDLTHNFINIDTLVDVLSTTQKSLGVKQLFQLNDEDAPEHKQSKPDINRENESSEEYYKRLHPEGEKWCECNVTYYDGYETEEDDDEPFVCDLCDSLGYGLKYRPEICDRCRKCETCMEYINDECSGCEYSVYRDGIFYRDKLPESEIIDADDLDVMSNFKFGYTGGCRKHQQPFTRFW